MSHIQAVEEFFETVKPVQTIIGPAPITDEEKYQRGKTNLLEKLRKGLVKLENGGSPACAKNKRIGGFGTVGVVKIDYHGIVFESQCHKDKKRESLEYLIQTTKDDVWKDKIMTNIQVKAEKIATGRANAKKAREG